MVGSFAAQADAESIGLLAVCVPYVFKIKTVLGGEEEKEIASLENNRVCPEKDIL